MSRGSLTARNVTIANNRAIGNLSVRAPHESNHDALVIIPPTKHLCQMVCTSRAT